MSVTVPDPNSSSILVISIVSSCSKMYSRISMNSLPKVVMNRLSMLQRHPERFPAGAGWAQGDWVGMMVTSSGWGGACWLSNKLLYGGFGLIKRILCSLHLKVHCYCTQLIGEPTWLDAQSHRGWARQRRAGPGGSWTLCRRRRRRWRPAETKGLAGWRRRRFNG